MVSDSRAEGDNMQEIWGEGRWDIAELLIKILRNSLLCLSSCTGTQQTESNQDEVFQLVNVLYNYIGLRNGPVFHTLGDLQQLILLARYKYLLY